MDNKYFLSPAEIAEATVNGGVRKTSLSIVRMLLLGILAGAFIAFASEGSDFAAYNLWADPTTYGLGKALAGAIFGTGLMMVMIAGAELFTGNNLIFMAVLSGKAKVSAMLKNWLFVYIGNFIGSVLIALLIAKSGQLGAGTDLLGATTIKIASYKVSLGFGEALILGILCNWLVCIAVWMATGAKTITGKILAIFFPIWLFIASGFEHSVANMYYIPAGIIAKANPAYAQAALNAGLTASKLDALNWGTFITKNLIPVTIGNIIGGALLVGMVYWFIYLKKGKA